MRRGLASLILGVSLVVATVAWSGFVLLHTVLDPGRSEALADEMLDNTVLRSALVDAIADSLEAGIPSGLTVPRNDIEAAAGLALDDPRVDAVVRDGLVRVHRNVLEGVDEPVVIDPSAFGTAARDALVGVHPQLDGALPAVPPAAIQLPDTGLSFLGDLRDLLEQTVGTASLAALGGVLLALLVTTDRPSVLRRVAVWAFAASAFWLILGYGLPWLAEQVLPQSAAVFAAGVQVFLGSMILPALLLAAGGVVLLLLSLLWSTIRTAGRASSRAGRRSRRAAPAPTYSPAGPPAPSSGPWRGGDDGWWPADDSWTGASHPSPSAAGRSGDATRVRPMSGGWGSSGTGGRDPSPWDETRIHRIANPQPWSAGEDRTVVRSDPRSFPPAGQRWDEAGHPGRHAGTERSLDPWASVPAAEDARSRSGPPTEATRALGSDADPGSPPTGATSALGSDAHPGGAPTEATSAARGDPDPTGPSTGSAGGVDRDGDDAGGPPTEATSAAQWEPDRRRPSSGDGAGSGRGKRNPSAAPRWVEGVGYIDE